MASIMGIDTAIGWAHWRVRGGWRNIGMTSVAFVAILGLVILMTTRLDPRPQQVMLMLGGWLPVLMMLEAGLLLLLGGTRVSSAVRTDITSRMIESHRLMPVSPWVAISGYLWGPTAQSVSMAASSFLVGLVVAMIAGISASAWIGPTIVLGTFAVFFWVVMAFLASIVRFPAGVVTTAVFAILVTEGELFPFFPGLMPLLTPFIGRTIFQLSAGPIAFDWPILVSWVVQVWIAVALYVGAARKYRRTEDSALGILPGLMVVAGWVAVSVVAMTYWDEYLPRWIWRRDLDFAPSLLGSFWTAMLLALVPLTNSARMPGSVLRMYGVALVCAAMLLPLGLVWNWRVDDLPRAICTTSIASFTLLLGCGYVLKIAYRFLARGIVPLIVWLLLICLVPLMVEQMLWAWTETYREFEVTWIAGLSPVGAVGMGWFDSKATVVPGLVGQIGFVLFWGAMYHLTQRRPVASPVPASP